MKAKVSKRPVPPPASELFDLATSEGRTRAWAYDLAVKGEFREGAVDLRAAPAPAAAPKPKARRGAKRS